MMQIPCPWCGARNDAEFVAGGEAHVERPNPQVDDEAWGAYLYFRSNTKGMHAERWFHAYGCRRWFNVIRDTVTHEIVRVYPMGGISCSAERKPSSDETAMSAGRAPQ